LSTVAQQSIVAADFIVAAQPTPLPMLSSVSYHIRRKVFVPNNMSDDGGFWQAPRLYVDSVDRTDGRPSVGSSRSIHK
jgi:hypothetical protein